MKTKEILAKTSDVLLEHGFSVEIDKNVRVFTKDTLREELNEFVKLPSDEVHINSASKKNSRKTGDKKRKNRKNMSNVIKQTNTKAEDEEHDYTDSDAPVLKKTSKGKRKRKQNSEKPESKLKNTDESNTSVKYGRRSQRLRSVKESV